MAGNTTFLRARVEGVDDLRRVLEQVGADLRKRTVQAALRDALAPVAQEARRLAPIGRSDFDRAVAILTGEQFRARREVEWQIGDGPVIRVEGRKGNAKLRSKAFKARALRDTIVITSQLSDSQRRRRGRQLTEFEAFVSATAPHAHLVEYGHALVRMVSQTQRDASRRGRAKPVKVKKVIGHVPAYPFLRPAFDAQKGAALTLFAAAIRKRIEELVARLGKQAVRDTLSKSNRTALLMFRSQG